MKHALYLVGMGGAIILACLVVVLVVMLVLDHLPGGRRP